MAKRKAKVIEFPAPVVPQVGARANCDRCKREIQVAPRRSEDSQPFRLAVIPKGVCPDCVMTQFLYNTYPINMQLDERGLEVLLHPQMRDAILMSGILDDCDMKVDEINWQRVVDNWTLPVEVRQSNTNPYSMGDAAKNKQALSETEDAVVAGDDIITELLLSAGVPRANIEKEIHSDSGTRIIGHGRSYSLEDLRKRRLARLKQVPPYPPPPHCRFCGYRGCLHCETEARKARKATAQKSFEELDPLGSKPS